MNTVLKGQNIDVKNLTGIFKSGDVVIELTTGGYQHHFASDHLTKDKNWLNQKANNQNTKNMVIVGQDKPL